MKEKLSKAEARYSPQSAGKALCAICRHFETAGRNRFAKPQERIAVCEVVEGEVALDGVFTQWSRRGLTEYERKTAT